MARQKSIGIRELRQNASKYVARAEAGESIEITLRGHPVAALTPLPDRASERDRLIAAGKLVPARRRLTDLGSPPQVEASGPASAALQRQREERFG